MADHFVAGLHCADVEDVAAAFVLGALEAHEADSVRQHLAGCPEAHPEFAELGSVVPALFETIDLVEPPATLRERILSAAAADTQRATDLQRTADTQRATDTQRTIDVPRARDAQRGGWTSVFRRPVWAGISLAAAIAVAALGAWNIQLRDEIEGLTAYRNGVVEVLEEAAEPGAQLAVLTAPEDPTGPTGLAAVGADGSVALVMRDLAPTSGTQVYETWLIGADGSPIPIGSFTVDASRTASFTTARASLGEGVTVALSLEPQAGATTPTVVVAAGKASAQS